MKNLKVYGGLTFVHVHQRRTIIAATSKAQAMRDLKAHGEPLSVGEFNNYWSETGNKKELEIALAKPGTVFRALPNGEFYEVEK